MGKSLMALVGRGSGEKRGDLDGKVDEGSEKFTGVHRSVNQTGACWPGDKTTSKTRSAEEEEFGEHLEADAWKNKVAVCERGIKRSRRHSLDGPLATFGQIVVGGTKYTCIFIRYVDPVGKVVRRKKKSASSLPDHAHSG
ncbi:hypothetical protein KM043_001667 [Ampulex compressa]|nr:hypothetical protein KM043_001667 [Ampulex compressa]